MQFSHSFMVYAKKVALVNLCKKFNQMVHDNLFKIKVKTKYIGNVPSGLLKIINIKTTGTFGKVHASLAIDEALINVSGTKGNYLLERPYVFHIA